MVGCQSFPELSHMVMQNLIAHNVHLVVGVESATKDLTHNLPLNRLPGIHSLLFRARWNDPVIRKGWKMKKKHFLCFKNLAYTAITCRCSCGAQSRFKRDSTKAGLFIRQRQLLKVHDECSDFPLMLFQKLSDTGWNEKLGADFTVSIRSKEKTAWKLKRKSTVSSRCMSSHFLHFTRELYP